MGIYAPHIKPYIELITLLTAEICACVDRKTFITDDNAVPKKTSVTTSRNSSITSAPVKNHPFTARYARQHKTAVSATISVFINVAT